MTDSTAAVTLYTNHSYKQLYPDSQGGGMWASRTSPNKYDPLLDKLKYSAHTRMKMKLFAVTVMVMMVCSVVTANKRVHRSRRGSSISQVTINNNKGKRGLAEMIASLLPNTYYSRPKFRYPYYHRDGKEPVSPKHSFTGVKSLQLSHFKSPSMKIFIDNIFNCV